MYVCVYVCTSNSMRIHIHTTEDTHVCIYHLSSFLIICGIVGFYFDRRGKKTFILSVWAHYFPD